MVSTPLLVINHATRQKSGWQTSCNYFSLCDWVEEEEETFLRSASNCATRGQKGNRNEKAYRRNGSSSSLTVNNEGRGKGRMGEGVGQEVTLEVS